MLRINSFIIFFSLLSIASAEFSGPYLIWGGKNLNALKVPALEAINTKRLHDELSKADAVIIYTRSSFNELNDFNYPELSKIIQDGQWLYLPQSSLTVESDLFKTEIFPAIAPTAQLQDRDIIEDYRKAQGHFKDVIGILAVYDDEQPLSEEHSRSKREHHEYKKPYVFVAPGRGILYTHTALILNDTKNYVVHELKNHATVIAEGDDYDPIFRLNVQFNLPDKSIWLKFVFDISESGYWKMSKVEYEDGDKKDVLYGVGVLPTAPIYVSYGCRGTFVFKSYNNYLSLILKNIQVQPRLDSESSRFDDAWDCNSYMTSGILSGLFVSSICLFVLFIAVTALMNIKTR